MDRGGVGSVGGHLDTSSCSRPRNELLLGQTVCSTVQECCAVCVFFVTDVFLFLDKLYQSKLLIPLEEGDTKQSLAGVEGNKIKL